MRTQSLQTAHKIIFAIEENAKKGNRSMTVREIAAQTSIPSATVQRYLVRMEAEGSIFYDKKGRPMTEVAQKYRQRSTKPVALLGEVACGLPCFAEANVEAYFHLPTALLGEGDYYLLRAKGESMIEAGIDDGDLVLIRQQNHAQSGDIAVVVYEEEATLKRYFPEPALKCVRLHPENKTMTDFYIADCAVQGVAVKVIKNL
ncbi:MAG: repressor LexA [Clostridia bacterium]|nr:repressor LexA [Clostridia bacterium]